MITKFNLFEKILTENIEEYSDTPDFRHLPKEFKIGDFVVGNIHISKDLSGKNLEQALFINKLIGQIVELFGNNAYRVEFSENIPTDDFYDVFGTGNKTGITIVGDKTSNKKVLSKREVRKPTKKEMEYYFLQKQSNKYNL